MAKKSSPRRGSLGFLPKKRANKPYPRVSSWPNSEETKLLGFAGYKAGMTQVFAIDQHKNSPSYNQEIAIPVTILECPPLKAKEIRAYKQTTHGLELIPKKELENKKESIAQIRLLVETNPPHKKKKEEFELAVGGNSAQALEYVKGLLGKEVKPTDVFKEGDYIDLLGVTKGKGIQGVVKRWGAKIQGRKAKGKRRHVGSINPWTPARTMWTALQAGQMGYHNRTSLNSRVIKLGENGEEVTKKGGIPHYGIVKNNYVLVKGSVPGTKKRLILIRHAIRNSKQTELPQVKEVAQ
ncbi:50S ribosomal protein L3 [archaeon]|nr:50S ribosomal protein L3 [archaeon]